MNHSLNLTHDGTLIVRVPKGYKVEKVKVETFEGEEIPTHTTPSNTLDALDYISRQDAIEAIEQMQMPIMRSEDIGEQFVFRGMSEALNGIKELPSVQPKERCIATITFSKEDLEKIVKEQVEEIKKMFPRKGKWLYRDGTIAEEYTYSVYCSKCGEWSEYYTNFCGSCGADMREGDTE